MLNFYTSGYRLSGPKPLLHAVLYLLSVLDTLSPHMVASPYRPANFLRAKPDGWCAMRTVFLQSKFEVIGTWRKAS